MRHLVLAALVSVALAEPVAAQLYTDPVDPAAPVDPVEPQWYPAPAAQQWRTQQWTAPTVGEIGREKDRRLERLQRENVRLLEQLQQEKNRRKMEWRRSWEEELRQQEERRRNNALENIERTIRCTQHPAAREVYLDCMGY